MCVVVGCGRKLARNPHGRAGTGHESMATISPSSTVLFFTTGGGQAACTKRWHCRSHPGRAPPCCCNKPLPDILFAPARPAGGDSPLSSSPKQPASFLCWSTPAAKRRLSCDRWSACGGWPDPIPRSWTAAAAAAVDNTGAKQHTSPTAHDAHNHGAPTTVCGPTTGPTVASLHSEHDAAHNYHPHHHHHYSARCQPKPRLWDWWRLARLDRGALPSSGCDRFELQHDYTHHGLD